MCVATALQRARDCKTRVDQVKACLDAQKWKDKLCKNQETMYTIVCCPFKLIYQASVSDGTTTSYSLSRSEPKHIHPMDFD